MNKKTKIIIGSLAFTGVALAIIGVIGTKKGWFSKSPNLGESETYPEFEPSPRQELPNPSSSSLPSGLNSVKAFQDWLDLKHPTWLHGKRLNKGGGYGNFGTNTKAAWSKYGSEYKSRIKYNAFQKGATVYAKSLTGLYTKPEVKRSYFVGTIKKYDLVGNYYGESSISGFSKVRVFKYYDGQDNSKYQKDPPMYFYVETSRLTKTKV